MKPALGSVWDSNDPRDPRRVKVVGYSEATRQVIVEAVPVNPKRPRTKIREEAFGVRAQRGFREAK